MGDSGRKKLLIIMGGIIGLVILIIIMLLIINAFTGHTNYSDIENKLVVSAKKYYKANPSLLPKSDSDEVSITDSSLTSAGYMKSMSDLTKKMKGSSCTGTVIVNYANGNYRYTPLLDCGEKYSSKTLASKISETEKIVYEGEGLYQLNGELVYRGENPNNYVKFGNKMWRIVKIDNNQLVLILNDKFLKSPWDDRYNVNRENNDGINNFGVSRIYEELQKAYSEDSILTANSKNLLAPYNLPIGKRSEDEILNDGSIEKGDILEKQYYGLLPLYDYMNASLDENCASSEDDSCSNYNYLNYYDYNWWTITADQSTTHRAYKITNYGTIEISRCSSESYVRPVVHLAKDVIYTKGDGTESNPYIIK